MKALLLHRDRDVEIESDPQPGHEALVADLGLDVVLEAMAGGDPYLGVVARKVVLAGLTEPEEITYRQRVLQDCIANPGVVRGIYDVAVAAIQGERQAWRIFTRDPELVVSMSVRAIELLLPLLHQLRRIAATEAATFSSDGFSAYFEMLGRELDEAYLAGLEAHLRRLRFPGGVSVTGRLGRRNTASDLVLRRPAGSPWRGWLRGARRGGQTIVIPARDDGGLQALAELRARGVNDVANAIGQAVDHVLAFFAMVRFEVGFYLAAMNLRERLLALGVPICFPQPHAPGTGVLRGRGLVDPGLALRTASPVVGNDLAADGRPLILVTGANQGGKSTFLRSIGLAQLMLAAGLFVGAEAFASEVGGRLASHFKRAEDASLRSGKLDEELGRFSEMVDWLGPSSLVLFNESFGATNEREGADIAEGIVRALLEARVRVAFVTHSHELARRFQPPDGTSDGAGRVLFLRAERLPDGRRTFRLVQAEPLATSFGADVFERVFGEPLPARRVG